MAGLTFLQAQQELADRLNLDQTIAANQTRLQRWLNLSQQDIASRYGFEWLKQRASFQTRKQETAGTVSVSAGGTTVTGVGTSFDTTNDVGQYIQFSGSNDLYYITAVASATSLTIEEAYAGATALSAATYTLTPVFYDLPANVNRVLDVRQFNSPMRLTQLPITTVDLFQPDVSVTGPPQVYSLVRNDPAIAVGGAKQLQVSVWPVPDAKYNLEVRYFKALGDLSGNTDISDIPVQWHGVWVTGAEWLGNKFLNDPEEGMSKQEFEYGVAKMIEQENELGDYHPVLQRSDGGTPTRFVQFPQAFEQPY